jgi:hypothetical protein
MLQQFKKENEEKRKMDYKEGTNSLQETDLLRATEDESINYEVRMLYKL